MSAHRRPTEEEPDVTLGRSARSAAVAAGAALALVLVTGCTSDDADPAAGTGASPAPSSAEPAEGEAVSTEPFGAGCADVPAEGEGSFAGMADDPVGTAASGIPLLTSLVEALTAANLLDSFNSQEAVTVLAPSNQAFEAVPAESLEEMLGDTALLTAVLTHHVIEGRLTPEQLAGEHTTLNGDTVVVEGSGQALSVPVGSTIAGEAPAAVVCGNIQTANATVYVIDQVLGLPG
jgi:uncharacterized surface protein with fasciclin (FAS1) repeats